MQAEALQRAGRDAAVGAGAAQWFTPSPRPVHPCSVVHPLPSLMLLSEQLQQLSDALSRPIRRLSTAAKVAMQVTPPWRWRHGWEATTGSSGCICPG